MCVRLSRTNAIASSGVPAPHRQDGAKIQRQRQEPRTGVSKHRCGLIEQAFRLAGIAGRQGDPAIPLSAFPAPHGIASARNPSTLRANRSRAASTLPSGVFDVPEQMLSLRDHLHVAGVVGERERARERRCGRARVLPARTTSMPLRRALSTRPRAEETAGSESVRTTGGLRPRARGSARRTSAPTRCRTLRQDGRAR